MSSSPVSEKAEMSVVDKELDNAPPPKKDDASSSASTPTGSDDEAYDSPKSHDEVNELAPRPPSTEQGTIPKMPVIPYRDRANAIIETLTDSDKKILRLYEENAVIGGPFPVKLQIILKVTEILGQQHIISWLPHGRSFMIHRPREFEEKIMGEFFKQTKLSSFKRQLNLYDFQRVTRGTDCGSYYHEMFLRGKPLLAKRMIRRKIKGTKSQSTSTNALTSSNNGDDQDHVPDFYTMPFVGTNRSGLDLQQASRVMSNTCATIPGMNLPHQGMQGGPGGVGDMNPSQYGNRLGVGGAGLSNAHLGPNSHLGGGMPLGGLAPTPSAAYDSLLSRGGAGPMNSGMGGFSPQAAALQQHNPHDLPLSSLQLQHQQLQLKNELMNPGHLMHSYPQQIQSTYAAAMENLNNSYALAANALRRDLDTASSNIMTQDELAAAKQLNRQAGVLPNSYNFNSQGW